MSQVIEVIVSPLGEIKIETKGFAGNMCRQASQSLEEALGRMQSEKLTAEFYQQAIGQIHIQERGPA